jgi:hypothetical protein
MEDLTSTLLLMGLVILCIAVTALVITTGGSLYAFAGGIIGGVFFKRMVRNRKR